VGNVTVAENLVIHTSLTFHLFPDIVPS